MSFCTELRLQAGCRRSRTGELREALQPYDYGSASKKPRTTVYDMAFSAPEPEARRHSNDGALSATTAVTSLCPSRTLPLLKKTLPSSMMWVSLALYQYHSLSPLYSGGDACACPRANTLCSDGEEDFGNAK